MAINAGTDINDGHGFPALLDAIKQNLTTEAVVNTALKRALRQLFVAGLFDQPSEDGSDWTQSITVEDIASPEHRRVRDDACLQSVVLLQNEPHAGRPLLPVRAYACRSCARCLTACRVEWLCAWQLAPGKKICRRPQADARSGLLSDYAVEQACADAPTTA